MSKVKTNGGTFSTDSPGKYAVLSTNRGCEIKMYFTPSDLVESPKIGFIQTVTTNVDGNVNDTGDSNRKAEQAKRGLGVDEEQEQGMAGRKIDRAAERTNPVYGTNNAPSGNKELGSSSTQSNTSFGKRVKNNSNTYDVVDAMLYDAPSRNAVANGKTSTQQFETAAVCLEGDMAGTYLGTVKWGYSKTTTDVVSLTPFSVVSMGVPTSSWMKAAEKWNKTTTNVGGTDEKNMEVPLVQHTTGPMPTTKTAINRKLIELRQKVAGLDSKKDKTTIKNIQFEIKALEARVIELDKGG